MEIRQFDEVRLREARPDLGLPAGAVGIVVDVYPILQADQELLSQPTGYEVEFLDAEGYTIALLTLEPQDIEAKPRT